MTAQHPGPRVGVVLSGGAAKGLAHIGVLQALERAGVPVDVIAGTSMGALVGGLYAVGYGADTLARIARAIDWDAVFSNRIARKYLQPEQKRTDGRHAITLPLRGLVPSLPSRIIDGHNVRQLLAEFTWPAALVRDFRLLPVPFAAVATDIETGDAVTFTTGPLLDALSATMAIPGVFAPVRVGARTLVDGGVVRNLPARDAEALGADVLICSDVTEPLKRAEDLSSVFGVVNQTLSLKSEVDHQEERRRCDILIEPDIEDVGSFDFRAVATWIARGNDAAEAVRARLDSLAAFTGQRVVRRSPPPVVGRLIEAVAPAGSDSAPTRLLRRGLDLDVPGVFGPIAVGEAMDRLYATREFERVDYVLAPGVDSGVRLLVQTGAPGPSDLGFGARYEGKYKASLLFTGTLRDRLGAASVASLDLRLGEQLRAATAYRRRLGTLTPWSIGAHAGYDRVPVDLYTNERRTAEGRFHILDAGGSFGVAVGTAALLSLVATGEHVLDRITTGAVDDSVQETEQTFYSVSAALLVDTRDAPTYPHGGVFVSGRATWADRDIGSGATFQHYVLRAEAAVPAGPVLSLLLRADLGAASGADLPPHYRFYLGGAVPYYMLPDRQRPFLGLRLQERSGRYLQVAGAGAQVRLPASLYAQALWNAGEVAETWSFTPETWSHGIGATLAWKTPFGTAAATLSGRAWEGPARFDFDLGFPF